MDFHNWIELGRKLAAVVFIVMAMYESAKGDKQEAVYSLTWAILCLV